MGELLAYEIQPLDNNSHSQQQVFTDELAGTCGLALQGSFSNHTVFARNVACLLKNRNRETTVTLTLLVEGFSKASQV